MKIVRGQATLVSHLFRLLTLVRFLVIATPHAGINVLGNLHPEWHTACRDSPLSLFRPLLKALFGDERLCSDLISRLMYDFETIFVAKHVALVNDIRNIVPLTLAK